MSADSHFKQFRSDFSFFAVIQCTSFRFNPPIKDNLQELNQLALKAYKLALGWHTSHWPAFVLPRCSNTMMYIPQNIYISFNGVCTMQTFQVIDSKIFIFNHNWCMYFKCLITGYYPLWINFFLEDLFITSVGVHTSSLIFLGGNIRFAVALYILPDLDRLLTTRNNITQTWRIYFVTSGVLAGGTEGARAPLENDFLGALKW